MELRRRLVHASGAGFPLLYLVGLASWQQLQALLVIGSVVAIVLETLRLRVGLDWRIFEQLTREYEQETIAGYALYMFSFTAVGLVFSPAVAAAGMLMLAWGDPISGVLGSNEPGSLKRPHVLGAMFLTCLAIGASTLYFETGETPETALLAGATGAVGATLADGYTPVISGHVIDDNLLIPPAGSIGIVAVLWIV